jgi:TatD DNase family protein
MIENAPKWIDFHCHIDLYPDYVNLITECEQAQVAVLAITTTPKAWKRNRELATGKFVRVALGLHPQLVAERASELSLWETLLPEARFIGEVGLDAGPRFYSSFNEQKMVFQRILEASAEAKNKILSVHSVRCTSMVLNMIERFLPADRGKVVLHWFTGSIAEARRAVEMGCYFSINADMMRSSRGRDLILALPLDRILTETDGPFGVLKNKPSRPTDMPLVVDDLAKLKENLVDLPLTLIRNWELLVGGNDSWLAS